MNTKTILFILQFIIWIPLLQKSIGFVEENPLNGEFITHEKPTLDSFITKWAEGYYQSDYEKYFNENFGFRTSVVRLFNQLDFTLYKKVHNAEVVIGKNNVFFDPRYIKTYLGYDFIGIEEINKKTENIKRAKDFLEKNNKRILIVLAPNKARYYKEHIPDTFALQGENNYKIFIDKFQSNDIDYIDFNQWFLSQKDKHEATLISKYGIHWTEYAVKYVQDSIISYCELNYKFNLPHYSLNSYIKTNVAQQKDNDILDALNILYKPTDETYFYYNKSVVNNDAKKNILVIGDSFYNTLYYQGFSNDIFTNNGFWYYNKQVIGESRKKTKEDLMSVLPKTDLVLIVCTEWNLYRLGFGIVEEINSFYSGETIEDFAVRDQIEKIRANKEWFEGVKKQAIERKIPLDSMLVRSAKYILEQKNKKS